MSIRSAGVALAVAIGVLASSPVEAQSETKIARIGYLSQLTEADDTANREAFRQGLRALGYLEGSNARIEARYANGQLEKLPELAAEIARLNVDVIVAAPTPVVRAIQQQTRSIPIVMAFVGDPVRDGFVSSLARPGGNITGLSAAVAEMAVKRVEFLKAVVPSLSHVAVLAPPESQGTVLTETRTAGQALGVQVVAMSVRNAADVDRSFAAMAAGNIDGVVVNLSLRQHTAQIVGAALSRRLPTVSSDEPFVAAGGLLAYGPHYPDLFRRAATYVDKLLKGAKPSDLPVEQPTKFELAVNLKTARALGITVPQSLLLRADHIVR